MLFSPGLSGGLIPRRFSNTQYRNWDSFDCFLNSACLADFSKLLYSLCFLIHPIRSYRTLLTASDLEQRYRTLDSFYDTLIFRIRPMKPSTTRMYYENSHSLPSLSYIKVPTGIVLSLADILLTPREWACAT